MVMACYQTSLAALQPKGPAIRGIFWEPKCVPDAWHWNRRMPPPSKAGLLSFLGQLGIETQRGSHCGLSGWGVLLLLRAKPVGSSWLRDLEGTGSWAQLEPQRCFHLPPEDCPAQKTPCLCSPAGANQDSSGPLSNANNAFLLVLFCLFIYIIFSCNFKLRTKMCLHGSLWSTKDFDILLAQWPFQEAEAVSQWRVADTLWFSLGEGERGKWLSLLWGNCPHHPPQVIIAFCWNNTFLNGI